MTKYDDLWNDLNNLLTHLRGFGAVELVEEFYQKYDNPFPAKLLAMGINDLQEHLDKAERRN